MKAYLVSVRVVMPDGIEHSFASSAIRSAVSQFAMPLLGGEKDVRARVTPLVEKEDRFFCSTTWAGEGDPP